MYIYIYTYAGWFVGRFAFLALTLWADQNSVGRCISADKPLPTNQESGALAKICPQCIL